MGGARPSFRTRVAASSSRTNSSPEALRYRRLGSDSADLATLAAPGGGLGVVSARVLSLSPVVRALNDRGPVRIDRYPADFPAVRRQAACHDLRLGGVSSRHECPHARAGSGEE